MRIYASRGGPFPERPFYKLEDIETLCFQELQSVQLYPSEPSPVRIDRFVEKRFNVGIEYGELPNGLLGFTRFGSAGVEAVVVSKELDEAGTRQAERRLRTTLAHEGGHCLLHAHLFALAQSPASLFGDDGAVDGGRILCREEGVSGMVALGKTRGYDGRWWEYQANQAMGALLLPRHLVEKGLDGRLVVQGLIGRPTLPANSRDAAIRRLTDIFDVNPIVARLRLEALFPAGSERQLTL